MSERDTLSRRFGRLIIASGGNGYGLVLSHGQAIDLQGEIECLEREQDRLSLQLDAIHGLATGQPGADPKTTGEGWSPALDAVQAVLRDRDEARDTAAIYQRHLDRTRAEQVAVYDRYMAASAREGARRMAELAQSARYLLESAEEDLDHGGMASRAWISGRNTWLAKWPETEGTR